MTDLFLTYSDNLETCSGIGKQTLLNLEEVSQNFNEIEKCLGDTDDLMKMLHDVMGLAIEISSTTEERSIDIEEDLHSQEVVVEEKIIISHGAAAVSDIEGKLSPENEFVESKGPSSSPEKTPSSIMQRKTSMEKHELQRDRRELDDAVAENTISDIDKMLGHTSTPREQLQEEKQKLHRRQNSSDIREFPPLKDTPLKSMDNIVEKGDKRDLSGENGTDTHIVVADPGLLKLDEKKAGTEDALNGALIQENEEPENAPSLAQSTVKPQEKPRRKYPAREKETESNGISKDEKMQDSGDQMKAGNQAVMITNKISENRGNINKIAGEDKKESTQSTQSESVCSKNHAKEKTTSRRRLAKQRQRWRKKKDSDHGKLQNAKKGKQRIPQSNQRKITTDARKLKNSTVDSGVITVSELKSVKEKAKTYEKEIARRSTNSLTRLPSRVSANTAGRKKTHVYRVKDVKQAAADKKRNKVVQRSFTDAVPGTRTRWRKKTQLGRETSSTTGLLPQYKPSCEFTPHAISTNRCKHCFRTKREHLAEEREKKKFKMILKG